MGELLPGCPQAFSEEKILVSKFVDLDDPTKLWDTLSRRVSVEEYSRNRTPTTPEELSKEIDLRKPFLAFTSVPLSAQEDWLVVFSDCFSSQRIRRFGLVGQSKRFLSKKTTEELWIKEWNKQSQTLKMTSLFVLITDSPLPSPPPDNLKELCVDISAAQFDSFFGPNISRLRRLAVADATR